MPIQRTSPHPGVSAPLPGGQRDTTIDPLALRSRWPHALFKGRRSADTIAAHLILGRERPQACPEGHPGAKIWLAGSRTSKRTHFERPRYVCVPKDGPRHRFTPLHSPRRPVEGHPKADDECEICEQAFLPGRGERSGLGFVYSLREIAKALALLGAGGTYRSVGLAVRKTSGRLSARGVGAGAPTDSVSLAVHYLDVFAGVVNHQLQARRWPRILVLDAIPLRDTTVLDGLPDELKEAWTDSKSQPFPFGQRQYREAVQAYNEKIEKEAARSEGKRSTKKDAAKRSEEQERESAALRIRSGGAILLASGMDSPKDPPRPILARFAGSEDEESWLEFLGLLESPDGGPEWVVADGAQAIRSAVGEHWPATTFYSCEAHLLMTAEEALLKDVRRLGDPQAALQIAVRQCLWSADNWRAMRKLAEQRESRELLKWARRLESPVLEQVEIRDRHPKHPFSNAAAEAFARKIGERLMKRGSNFGNALRLNKLLALFTLDIQGEASEGVYSRLLRTAMERRHGRLRLGQRGWHRFADGSLETTEVETHGPRKGKLRLTPNPSIKRVIAAAILRNATVGEERRRRREAPKKAARHRRRTARVEAKRVAQGLPPNPGRRHAAPSAVVVLDGKMLTDFPKVLAQFDRAANDGIDPEKLHAGSNVKYHWLCAEGHTTFAGVGARIRARCGYCSGRLVTLEKSLRGMAPDLADEMHPTLNGTLVAEKIAWASDRVVVWQCRRNPKHVWPARVNSRTQLGSGCRHCLKEQGKRSGRRPSSVPVPKEPKPVLKRSSSADRSKGGRRRDPDPDKLAVR